MVKAKLLPSGSWRSRAEYKDENGKRCWKSFTATTEDKANLLALQFEESYNYENLPENITLSQAIDKYILKKSPVLSPATTATYKKLKRNYFSTLLHKKLMQITQDDIQKEINIQAKTLSPKTIKCNHGFLSAVFGEYRPNFTLHTTLPRNKPYIPTIPDADSIKIILAAVKGTNIEVPVLLALWLGLRMSEIRGLKWENVKGDLIYIKEAIVDADNVATLKGTKSDAGTRVLLMPKYLKGLIEKQPHTSEYVVTMKRPTIYDNYIRMLTTAGLPHSRFHDLRHANASIMLALGIPDKYAQERLGHATNSTLKNIYQHTLNSEKKDVSDKISGYFEALCDTNCDTKII